jgi:hypothetical protein
MVFPRNEQITLYKSAALYAGCWRRFLIHSVPNIRRIFNIKLEDVMMNYIGVCDSRKAAIACSAVSERPRRYASFQTVSSTRARICIIITCTVGWLVSHEAEPIAPSKPLDAPHSCTACTLAVIGSGSSRMPTAKPSNPMPVPRNCW